MTLNIDEKLDKMDQSFYIESLHCKILSGNSRVFNNDNVFFTVE